MTGKAWKQPPWASKRFPPAWVSGSISANIHGGEYFRREAAASAESCLKCWTDVSDRMVLHVLTALMHWQQKVSILSLCSIICKFSRFRGDRTNLHLKVWCLSIARGTVDKAEAVRLPGGGLRSLVLGFWSVWSFDVPMFSGGSLAWRVFNIVPANFQLGIICAEHLSKKRPFKYSGHG